MHTEYVGLIKALYGSLGGREEQNKTESITRLINQVKCKLIIKKSLAFKHSRGSDAVAYMKQVR